MQFYCNSSVGRPPYDHSRKQWHVRFYRFIEWSRTAVELTSNCRCDAQERRSWVLRGPDPVKICRSGQSMFWLPKCVTNFHPKLLLDYSSSFISSAKLIFRVMFMLSGTGIVECLGTIDIWCNLKQFDGLTWLTLTPIFYDISMPLVMSVRDATMTELTGRWQTGCTTGLQWHSEPVRLASASGRATVDVSWTVWRIRGSHRGWLRPRSYPRERRWLYLPQRQTSRQQHQCQTVRHFCVDCFTTAANDVMGSVCLSVRLEIGQPNSERTHIKQTYCVDRLWDRKELINFWNWSTSQSGLWIRKTTFPHEF